MVLNLSRLTTLRNIYIEISRFVQEVERARNCTSKAAQCQRTWIARGFHTTPKRLSEAGKEASNAALFVNFKKSFNLPARTHEIAHLDTPGLIGEVTLHGYLGSRNDLSKKLSFVPLISHDLQHSVQIVSTPKSRDGKPADVHEKLRDLDAHTPVVIRGQLKQREPSPKSKLGGDLKKITANEIELLDLQVLNEFSKDIIFQPDTIFPSEMRHLQLRSDKSTRNALKLRAQAAQVCRDVLAKDFDFTEIETPLLFKSTPEGAREFVVPTRQKGYAYALPQSPQQFKQTLMASGIARYYQFARCFRDEDLRADRQPEFTQLDLEASFVTGEDIMQIMETLIRKLWKEMLSIDLPSPFPRMTYHQAMSEYGSDKPDTRFDMKISRIEHLLPADLISKISPLSSPAVELMAMNFPEGESSPAITRKFISEFMSSPDAIPFNENPHGGPGIFIYDSRQPLQGLQPFGFEAAEVIEGLLSPEDGTLVVLQSRPNDPYYGGSTSIGNLRLALHRHAVNQSLLPQPTGFKPFWIHSFPLFTPTISDASDPGQGGTTGLSSTHHPFTAPLRLKDLEVLLKNPRDALADHYDLTLNGVELGGGSKRIHSSALQEYILSQTLGMPPSRIAEFSHLLKILRAGCPPHAGMALGWDRVVAMMCGKESVRDVIAFPKSGKGEDALMGAPSELREEELERYGLKVDGGEGKGR